jgi:DnaK suppressor protein
MERINAKRYRSHILILLARLRDDLSRMADVGAATWRITPNPELTRMPIHLADIAVDNSDRECELSLLESKEKTVRQLEDALDRIELGTYGRCEDCGERISKARLAAVPHATRCIKCASRIERG